MIGEAASWPQECSGRKRHGSCGDDELKSWRNLTMVKRNREKKPARTRAKSQQGLPVLHTALNENVRRNVYGLVGPCANDDDEDDGEEMVHVCCVCVVRHKGAAFIPCGHTFCRLCSRELWVSRSNCPLCNGFIQEILDIF
ncbi:hypothetical protein EJB05_17958, partial [Eragrostis curvula]